MTFFAENNARRGIPFSTQSMTSSVISDPVVDNGVFNNVGCYIYRMMTISSVVGCYLQQDARVFICKRVLYVVPSAILCNSIIVSIPSISFALLSPTSFHDARFLISLFCSVALCEQGRRLAQAEQLLHVSPPQVLDVAAAVEPRTFGRTSRNLNSYPRESLFLVSRHSLSHRRRHACRRPARLLLASLVASFFDRPRNLP